MMFFSFFDFLYLWFFKAYKRAGDDSSEFIASAVVSFLQTINICSIVFTIEQVSDSRESGITKLIALAIFVGLTVVNYVKYLWISKFKVEAIEERWNLRSESSRKIRRIFQIMYVILSSAVYLGLVIFYSKLKG